MRCLALCFIVRLASVILGPLCSYMDCNIFFFTCVKNVIENLMGIELNMQLGNVVIFTILILPFCWLRYLLRH